MRAYFRYKYICQLIWESALAADTFFYTYYILHQRICWVQLRAVAVWLDNWTARSSQPTPETDKLRFWLNYGDMYTPQGAQDQTSGETALWTGHGRQGGPGNQGLNNHTFTASSTSTMTMPQNIFTNPAIQPSSVINLSNSTDVVIGPMTQYQGPVSIYYMDASMQTAAGELPKGEPSLRASRIMFKICQIFMEFL